MNYLAHFSEIKPRHVSAIQAAALMSYSNIALSGVESLDDLDQLLVMPAELNESEYSHYCALSSRVWEPGQAQSTTIRTTASITGPRILRTAAIIDVMIDGQTAGYGTINPRVWPETGEIRPTVGFIRNQSDYMRQGFGRRRYIAMNVASILLYDAPLHSSPDGPLRTPEASRCWRKLVEEGIAEPYQGINAFGIATEQFRFTSPS